MSEEPEVIAKLRYLHDDGTLCCAVCAQILETGALE
jgi:hypothetical protein